MFIIEFSYVYCSFITAQYSPPSPHFFFSLPLFVVMNGDFRTFNTDTVVTTVGEKKATHLKKIFFYDILGHQHLMRMVWNQSDLWNCFVVVVFATCTYAMVKLDTQ